MWSELIFGSYVYTYCFQHSYSCTMTVYSLLAPSCLVFTCKDKVAVCS